jgi:hypothetical protein
MSQDEENISDRWGSFFPKSGTEGNALNMVIYLSITVKYIQLFSMNFKDFSRREAKYALQIRSKCIYRDIITLVVAVSSDIMDGCCWG